MTTPKIDGMQPAVVQAITTLSCEMMQTFEIAEEDVGTLTTSDGQTELVLLFHKANRSFLYVPAAQVEMMNQIGNEPVAFTPLLSATYPGGDRLPTTFMGLPVFCLEPSLRPNVEPSV